MPNCRCVKGNSLVLALVVFAIATLAVGAADRGIVLKTDSFDRNPHWEGFNNRPTPKVIPTITQDFGFSESHFAGRTRGEIGGKVWRATAPAYYADKIPARTLDEPLHASGTFALTELGGSSGAFFGWFNARQPGGGRPVSSLGLDLDGESTGARLAVRLISSGNKSCGTFITPFISGKYRPTPIKLNVHYQWTLNYDPAANHGNGRFQFVIRGDGTKPEEFEGKTFSVDVPAVIRKEGATFDRFGLMNMGRAGNPLSIYFDDLEYDGMKQDFSRVPNWEGVGNRVSYPERDHPGLQNFGFSADTSFAGGRPGEIGGTFWRTERNPGYYADRIGRLTLNEPLEARGKVIMQIGAPDSGMCLGWFNSAANDIPRHNKDFLGVEIGGPTRIGHYFSPRCATADGTTRKVDKGPILVPGKIYAWSISYDPSANGNNGAVCVTLGSESVTLDLNPGDKARGATFDCFGLASTSPGGGMLKIYFNDLLYTAGR